MGMGMRRRGRAVLFGGLLFVPAMYFALLVPNGTPVAEGCSGGGSYQPPTGVTALRSADVDVDDELATATPVGLDGFFVTLVYSREVDDADLVSALTFAVTDATGATVPGTAQRLNTTTNQQGLAFVGWQADQELAPDQTLTAVVSGSSSSGPVSLTLSLAVHDSTPTLAVPPATFVAWSREVHDTGAPVTCPGSGCVSATFGADTETRYVADLELPLSTEVMVAWEVSFAEVAGKGTLGPLGPDFDASNGPVFLGGAANTRDWDLPFAEQLDEYCVSVTVRDLRTDQTATDERCSSTPRFDDTQNDKISQCEAVPNAFNSRWCAARGFNCGGATGQGGSGGYSGWSGAGGQATLAGSGGVPGSSDAPLAGSAGIPTTGVAGTTNDSPPPSDAAVPSDAGVPSDSAAPSDTAVPADSAGNDEHEVVTHGCGCRLADARQRGVPFWVASGLLGLALFLRRGRRAA